MIQAIGASTTELCALQVGDSIQDVAGPLGKETELREAGDVIACTDDGTYGRHGFVTQALGDLLEAGGVDAVYAVGFAPMMRRRLGAHPPERRPHHRVA